MVDILHRVGVKGSTAHVYDALATRDGLASWWTRETEGEGGVGQLITFRFGTLGFFVMKVRQLEPGRRVSWEVVDGPAEWIGTRVVFDLKQEDGHAIVLFSHEGWREPSEGMHHCSTKWATFLMSLKSLVETGAGAPAPDDVKIDNWN